MNDRHSRQERSLNGAGVVLALTLLAFATRLYRLDAIEFWFDEAGSYFIAVKGYAEMLAYLRQAVSEHPPLYYLSLHLWLQLVGTSEFALRYLSLIIGTLFVPMLYRFARREFGDGIGVGAALAATFSPFMFVYSQEARMYSLLPVLALLALDAFLNIVRIGGLRDWLAFGAISLIGLATHYYFVLLFAGELLFILWRWPLLPRRVVARWVALAAAVALLLGLWLLAAPGFFATLLGSLVDPNLSPWYVRVERVARDMITIPRFGYEFDAPVRFVVLLGWLPILFAVRARAGTPNQSQTRDLLFSLAVAGLMMIGLLPRDVIGRQGGVMLPAVLVLLVLGLHELFVRRRTAGALAFVLILLLFTLGLFEQTQVDKEQWGAALATLAREAQSGDALVLTKPTAWPTMVYYHHRADLPVYYLPQPDGELSEQQLTTFMQPIIASHKRVWLAETGSNTLDPNNLTAQWLAQRAFAAQADYFRSVSFYLFVNGATETEQANVAVFGQHIHLQQVQVSARQLKPGAALLLHMRWLTDERIPGDDSVVLQLVDASGMVWAERRLLPCGGHCATSEWNVDETIDDREAFVVPAGTPPDNYRLLLSVYDPRTRTLLAVQNTTALELGRVAVMPDPDAVVPATTHSIGARFAGALELVGYNATEQSVQLAEPWPIELVWRADERIGDDVRAVFQWLDASGNVVAERDAPVGTHTYPASVWQPGEVIRQRFSVLAPESTAGDLQLALQVRDAVTQRGLPATLSASSAMPFMPGVNAATADAFSTERVLLQTVRVQEVERRFIAPELAHSTNALFGEQTKLLGFQKELTHNWLDVTLYWRALTSSRTRYKVFVHLLNDAQQVVAQHDAEPANDLRPTIGWRSGEYVDDLHRIYLANVPAGNYRIEVGMYNPDTGERVPVVVAQMEQPERRVILTTVHVP